MLGSMMDRRRLLLAALLAAATTALTRRSGRAVHVAWEASLQAGTCAAPEAEGRVRLGDPTYGVPVGVAGTPVGTPPIRFRSVGPDPHLPVVTSTATVDAPLADLLDVPHSVVVESVDLEADTRTPIACGNVGGVPTDDEVVFGLRSLLADTSGVAWLQGNADGTTAVTLFVTQGLSAVEAGPGHTPVPGTPAAEPETPETPAAGTPPAAPVAPNEVTIGSYDIYFDPNEVTIPADTDVTVNLPNHGVTLHNFSVTDHNQYPGVPNLGIDVDLAVGATETVTINAPAGDYYFFCNVPGHEAAGMFGTMHVL
jgi:nitrite reductase (NO-forming)